LAVLIEPTLIDPVLIDPVVINGNPFDAGLLSAKLVADGAGVVLAGPTRPVYKVEILASYSQDPTISALNLRQVSFFLNTQIAKG
jgi:hypothetical protein